MGVQERTNFMRAIDEWKKARSEPIISNMAIQQTSDAKEQNVFYRLSHSRDIDRTFLSVA